MIYLDTENIIIPNLLGNDSSIYTLIFKNNITNEEFVLDASNLSDNELYFKFVLDSSDASELSSNEYTIAVYDSSLCIGTYLAQKGINKQEKTVFENDTEYIQFD